MELDRKNRITSLILVLILILPMGIGVMHAVHEHENQRCHDQSESHIHAEKSDCSHLHYFNQTLDQNFTEDKNFNFAQWFDMEDASIEVSITVSFPSTDPDRGPPVIMAF